MSIKFAHISHVELTDKWRMLEKYANSSKTTSQCDLIDVGSLERLGFDRETRNVPVTSTPRVIPLKLASSLESTSTPSRSDLLADDRPRGFTSKLFVLAVVLLSMLLVSLLASGSIGPDYFSCCHKRNKYLLFNEINLNDQYTMPPC